MLMPAGLCCGDLPWSCSDVAISGRRGDNGPLRMRSHVTPSQFADKLDAGAATVAITARQPCSGSFLTREAKDQGKQQCDPRAGSGLPASSGMLWQDRVQEPSASLLSLAIHKQWPMFMHVLARQRRGAHESTANKPELSEARALPDLRLKDRNPCLDLELANHNTRSTGRPGAPALTALHNGTSSTDPAGQPNPSLKQPAELTSAAPQPRSRPGLPAFVCVLARAVAQRFKREQM